MPTERFADAHSRVREARDLCFQDVFWREHELKHAAASLQVPAMLAESKHLRDDTERAFKDAMVGANSQLHSSSVDDSMSGTTAINCLLRGRTAYIANVGDSRAVMAERGAGDILKPCPLSKDQTPFRYAA